MLLLLAIPTVLIVLAAAYARTDDSVFHPGDHSVEIDYEPLAVDPDYLVVGSFSGKGRFW
ncbi:hypothetical protein ACFLWA_02335 [Chloroflexota bacterium]